MQAAIKAKLEQMEQEEQVRILYACESGSRAWGFASTDSDYDVRFVYCHRTNWYLSIDDQRDILNRPIEDNVDLSGWDIRKALRLFRKSNPPLLEWLDSPILYHSRGRFAESLRQLRSQYYLQGLACITTGTWPKVILTSIWEENSSHRSDISTCCGRSWRKWIEAGRAVVPMEFAQLVSALLAPGELNDAISTLLEVKKQGVELGEGPRIPTIHGFLSAELSRLAEERGAPEAPTSDLSALNELFRATLREVWES